MTDWYYADAQNQRHGPLPASELAALHAQGALRPETLVWREGLAAWTPWRQVMQEVVPPTPAAAGAPPVPPPASDDASPYAPPRAALHDDSAVVAGNHVVYAGFWKRVAASIIDSFVTSMLFWVIMIPVFAIAGGGLSAISSLGDGTAGALFTAAYYLTSILIPMVAHMSEVRLTLEAVSKARQQLDEAGKPYGQVDLGAMIEIPAAALQVAAFLRHFDFVSIGTNDLIQYTLAIDRADESVAHLYDPLHPAVLRLVAETIAECNAKGKGVSVCGEMAGDIALTRRRLGLGLRSFSMHPAQILSVKQEVLRADTARLEPWARAIVTSAEQIVETAARVERTAHRLIERARDAFRDVSELSQSRLGRVRTIVREGYSLTSQRTTMVSKDDTSIDGKRILLG